MMTQTRKAMKRLVCLALALVSLLALSACGKGGKEDGDSSGANGRSLSAVQFTKSQWFGDDGDKQTLVYDYSYEYDAQGHLIRKYLTTKGGSETDVNTFEYDDDGKLIRKTVEGLTGDTGWVEYSYDKQGRLTEVVSYLDGGAEYEYDIWFNHSYWYPAFAPNDRLEAHEVYSYDEDGKLIEAESYVHKDTKVLEVFEYDADDRLVAIERYSIKEDGSRSDTPSSTDTLEYNADGTLRQITSERSGQNGPITESIEYEYDGDGRLIASKQESRSIYWTYTYDKSGTLTSVTYQILEGHPNFEEIYDLSYAKGSGAFHYGLNDLLPVSLFPEF